MAADMAMPRWSQGDKCMSPYSGDNRLYRGIIKNIRQSPTGAMALVKFDGYHESQSEEVSLDKLVKVNDQNVKGNSNSGGYVEGSTSQDSHFKKPLIPETFMNVTNQGNMVQNQSTQEYVDNNNGNQNGNSREGKRARSNSREKSTVNREGNSTEGSNERSRSKDKSSGNSGERRHSQGRDRSGSKETRWKQSPNQWQGNQSQIGQDQNRSYASPNSGYNSSFYAQSPGGRGCQGGYNSSYGQTQDSRFRRDDDSDVFLSKTLSSILRHNAKNFGLELMKGGFLYVDEILRRVNKLKYYTNEDFKRIVDSNDKKRFSMESEGGRLKIRANQGHSIQVEDLDLTPITSADDVPIVVHGTYEEAWELIKETGLHRMNRNHIHFAAGEPGKSGVISGMRSTCQVMIYIDMEKALKDGLKFCRSANNVILCDGDKDGIIYPCYFRGVLHRFGRYKMPYDMTICSASINSKTAAAETDGNKKRKKKSKKDKQEKSAEKWDEETLDANTKEHNDGASTDESSLPAAKKQHLQQSTDDAKPAADNSSVNDIISASQKEDNVVEKYEDWVGEPTYITDLDQSKCCVDYLIKKPDPSHIAVCCIGENLGEAESQINVIVISVYPNTYVYNLHDNKMLVEDGELSRLLMHKNIPKVFCDIGSASASLINEYDLLLDGTPIWDIGMTYSKVTLPAMQLEALEGKYGFTKSTVKQWASQHEEFGKKLMSNELDETVVNKLMERGKLIWELFAYCQKQFNDDLVRALKKEAYPAAMSSNDNFLAEKIAKLKLERKSKKKQENVEGVTQQQSQQQQQQQQHKKGKGASQQQKKGKSGKGKR